MLLLSRVLAGACVLAAPVLLFQHRTVFAAQAATNDSSISSDWWSCARVQLEAEEYVASVAAAGLQAPNRANNLRTYFRDHGIEVVPRVRAEGGASWTWAWRLRRFGREAHLHRLPPATPIANRTIIRYERQGLVEWYENRRDGLEQRFTIERRPEGRGALIIEGRAGGPLSARTGNSGEAVYLDASGAPILHYGGLEARDAAGRSLPCGLGVDGSVLRIRIDDQAAVYPIEVDPLIRPASWSYESNDAGAHLGYSVSTAGDVNSDGYSDIIVGAPMFEVSGLEVGRVFVFHGSASGPAAVPDWTVDGIQAGEQFGFSVAAIGDITADGYDDVIIGAPYWDFHPDPFPPVVDAGRVDVFYGSATGLATSPGTGASSTSYAALMGYAVAGVGDVDGNGRSDYAYGAPGLSTFGDTRGRVYVRRPGNPYYTEEIDGSSDGEQLGICVAPAGDVNGDGYADVAMGSTTAVQVYHGSASGLPSAATWTTPGVTGIATTVGDINGDGYAELGIASYGSDLGADEFGTTRLYRGTAAGLDSAPFDTEIGYPVAPAGDANGDGYADVAIAERYWACGCGNFHCPELCPVYSLAQLKLYQGSPSGVVASSVVSAGLPEGTSPMMLAAAGDVNGDGYGDIITGFPQTSIGGQSEEGIACLVYGKATGLAVTAGWNTSTTQLEGEAGYSVAGVGDVNGDGYSDIAVGGPLFDNGETDEGRVAVYLGGASGPSTSAAFSAYSDQPFANLGTSVAGAGDVNGDGYADMIFGAPSYTNGESLEGRAYLFYGAQDISNPASWTTEGNQIEAWLGFSVAGAGDVNGDGYGDFLIGAPQYDNGQAEEGRAMLFFGAAKGPAPAPAWIAENNAKGARMGWSVAGAGDVNGDGLSDVVVGSPQFANGQALEGRFDVYHGSGSGPSAIPAVTVESNEIGAQLGYSVATAGDVNGDGFSDIIVGKPLADDGQTDEGVAHVYLGSAAGIVDPPAWSMGSDQGNARFGHAVACAGDVNGDGFSDVIVGARDYNNVQLHEGRAFVYHGAAGGLATSAAWTAEPDQADASFGFAVASCGDVNGDGFSDVIVGAPFYDTPNSNAGRAWIYYGNGGRGLDRAPRQAVMDDSRPIDLLGKMPDDRIRLKALGRSAAGRERVWLEWEVKPLGTAFDVALSSGTPLDTGAPVGGTGSAVALNEQTAAIAAGTPYRWRMRIASRSPYFPWSRWLTLPGNAVTETDLRRLSAVAFVPPRGHDGELRLDPAAPNPFTNESNLSFVLPARAEVTLAIYDIRGRRIASPAGGTWDAGPHRVVWDGRDSRGNPVAPGLYLVRLTAGGASSWSKVVRIR